MKEENMITEFTKYIESGLNSYNFKGTYIFETKIIEVDDENDKRYTAISESIIDGRTFAASFPLTHKSILDSDLVVGEKFNIEVSV